MGETTDKIIELAKNLFGHGEDEVKQMVDEGKSTGNDLFDMAKGLVGDLTPGDMDLLGVAKGFLGKLDSPVDIVGMLKDGKIDMQDLLALGSILTKITK